MSFDSTSNNKYVQVGVNHGNIYTRTDPISVTHSQDTPTPNVGDNIDSATKVALLQALVKTQRCLDVAQSAVSQNTQTAGAAERMSSLLLDIKKLDPGQWGSLETGVITSVFSLLYCCIMECYELRPTTLAISSLGNQVDACNLALQCVHGAAIVDQNDRRSVSAQQQKVTEAIEQMDKLRAKYLDELKQLEAAIYHSQVILDLLKRNSEPDLAARFEGMHVSFGGENRGIQAVEYCIMEGRNVLPFPSR
ncbi:unnamed protein product [Penicillium salamii]|uniref:Uncharacterized protein n=1 Tax=Penicillium salamii TaxID=1612424 RepID=A0A9W4MXZ6_9EURO|nr:unnamed protein product [Penicillium salamii]CAG7971404.1 unnamed protein product [Penicillium salamii]CAG7988184.1 unnamed protein product [Penicillium salamii]CAG7992276.1 unnamed protein product [Penicillium salamii]CAG7997666.1 unnamed protein product [Penicillium salamii]